MPRYSAIPRRLLKELEAVPPSLDRDVKYHPCAVTLDDGRELGRVYVMKYEPYIRLWGVTPEQDPAKRSISIERVVSIRESPFRLPPHLATSLYSAGESGMGYCIFTVEFSTAPSRPTSPGTRWTSSHLRPASRHATPGESTRTRGAKRRPSAAPSTSGACTRVSPTPPDSRRADARGFCRPPSALWGGVSGAPRAGAGRAAHHPARAARRSGQPAGLRACGSAAAPLGGLFWNVVHLGVSWCGGDLRR